MTERLDNKVALKDGKIYSNENLFMPSSNIRHGQLQANNSDQAAY